MYTDRNFRTKKDLIAAFNRGEQLTVYQPGGMFHGKIDGNAVIEGPHYPEPHRFYVSVVINDGIIVKVNR